MFDRNLVGVPAVLSRVAFLLAALLALLASGVPAQTFTVNTTSDEDDGACTVVHCSLREALQAANGVPGALVAFDIPGPGPYTISPRSALPALMGPLVLDGTTQSGFAGSPLIELDGSLAGPVHGLSVVGSGNEIRGLVVNRFQFSGIALESGTSANRVEGCFIGTDVTGTLARGNGNAGILVGQTSGNVIGGSTAQQRNVISGNAEGVAITDATATGNDVIGNYIGTDLTGTVAIPNGTGVLVLAPDNRIGGEGPGQGNVISGNQFNGVDLGPPNAVRNFVLGNLIGTDVTGVAPLGNDIGVWVNNVSDNVIGGETPGARNVISGNREGVTIWDAGGTMNHVMGNFIGTNAAGSQAIANEVGVVVYGPGNIVGGFMPGTGNLISGNLREGVSVNGPQAGSNLVQGNLVGTDATGMDPLPNGQSGILVVNAVGTLVGGPQEGAGNLASGNAGPGISIIGGESEANLLQGNWVGVNLDGDQALPNTGDGINVDGATGTWIGGRGTHEGNVVSGNGAWGVHIWGGTDALLEGNLIGLATDGTSALGNAEGGVFLQDTPDNFIGLATAGARNVISGNVGPGIMVLGALSTGNVIQGNYIGTDATGTVALANDVGVWLNGAVNSLVGGTLPAEGNVISGNTLHAMRIGAGATGSRVHGNRMGVDATGNPLGNGVWGIHLFDGAADNLIGGDGAGSGNIIAHNGGDGIVVRGDATVGNQIRSNAIHDNGELGIDLLPDGVDTNDAGDEDTGPNGSLNHPVVMGVATNGGVLAKALMFDGLASELYTFEFFGNSACDPSGFGEGEITLGTVQISSAADGDASIAIPLAATTHLTATATDEAGNTSEFSPCVALSDFSLEISPSTRTVPAGGSATYEVTVSAVGGPFSDAVELDCTGGPAGSTCTFTEPELIPGEQSATTTMTVSTSSAQLASTWGAWAWSLLVAAGLLLAVGRSGHRRRLPLVLVIGALGAVGALACSDNGTGPEEPSPVTYQIQVTGEWEGITHGQTATLIVN